MLQGVRDVAARTFKPAPKPLRTLANTEGKGVNVAVTENNMPQVTKYINTAMDVNRIFNHNESLTAVVARVEFDPVDKTPGSSYFSDIQTLVMIRLLLSGDIVFKKNTTAEVYEAIGKIPDFNSFAEKNGLSKQKISEMRADAEIILQGKYTPLKYVITCVKTLGRKLFKKMLLKLIPYGGVAYGIAGLVYGIVLTRAANQYSATGSTPEYLLSSPQKGLVGWIKAPKSEYRNLPTGRSVSVSTGGEINPNTFDINKISNPSSLDIYGLTSLCKKSERTDVFTFCDGPNDYTTGYIPQWFSWRSSNGAPLQYSSLPPSLQPPTMPSVPDPPVVPNIILGQADQLGIDRASLFGFMNRFKLLDTDPVYLPEYQRLQAKLNSAYARTGGQSSPESDQIRDQIDTFTRDYSKALEDFKPEMDEYRKMATIAVNKYVYDYNTWYSEYFDNAYELAAEDKSTGIYEFMHRNQNKDEITEDFVDALPFVGLATVTVALLSMYGTIKTSILENKEEAQKYNLAVIKSIDDCLLSKKDILDILKSPEFTLPIVGDTVKQNNGTFPALKNPEALGVMYAYINMINKKSLKTPELRALQLRDFVAGKMKPKVKKNNWAAAPAKNQFYPGAPAALAVRAEGEAHAAQVANQRAGYRRKTRKHTKRSRKTRRK